ALVAEAERSSAESVAVVFDLPLALVLDRNASRRDRRVDPEVVTRQWRALARTLALGSIATDGFDLIVRLGATDVDDVRFERPTSGELQPGERVPESA